MLKKLIKYDLKWSLKVVIIYIILGLSLSVIGRIISLLPDSIFFNFLEGVLKGAGVSLSISALVNAVIRTWVRIIQNMYKDESYLTHTLPIETKKHYYSKIISTIIVCCLCMVSIVLCFILSYLNEGTIEFLKTSLNMITNNLNTSIIFMIIIITIILILEILFIVLSGFCGIIYGYSFNNKKLGKSFLFGFMFYGISTGVMLILVILMSLFNQNLYNMMFNGIETFDFTTLKNILIISSVLYFILNISLIFVSTHKLNKGVNIE